MSRLQNLPELHLFPVGPQNVEKAHALGPEGQGLYAALQGAVAGGLDRLPGCLHVLHIQADVVNGPRPAYGLPVLIGLYTQARKQTFSPLFTVS